MDLLREYLELNEAESTVDMFWDVLSAMLELADTSADKVLVNTILDHTAMRTLMTRSKMGLRSKLKGDARSKLIILLRTINHVHDKLKKAGDVYVDKSVPDKAPEKDLKPVKEAKGAKIVAKDKIEPEQAAHHKKDAESKILTPDELPKLLKDLIIFADPDNSKKLSKAVLILGPMKTLMNRARAVSARVPSLVRHRLEDFQTSISSR